MIYLEGTDGVGKTSTIKYLEKYNIKVCDREKNVFSKNMLFDIPMEDRITKYTSYLKKHNDIIIFLINNDKEELMERIYKREVINEFDELAYEYNELYLKTFNEMKKRNLLFEKLYLIDVTHMTMEKQVSEVKSLIDSISA